MTTSFQKRTSSSSCSRARCCSTSRIARPSRSSPTRLFTRAQGRRAPHPRPGAHRDSHRREGRGRAHRRLRPAAEGELRCPGESRAVTRSATAALTCPRRFASASMSSRARKRTWPVHRRPSRGGRVHLRRSWRGVPTPRARRSSGSPRHSASRAFRSFSRPRATSTAARGGGHRHARPDHRHRCSRSTRPCSRPRSPPTTRRRGDRAQGRPRGGRGRRRPDLPRRSHRALRHRPDGLLRELPAPPADAARPPRRGGREPRARRASRKLGGGARPDRARGFSAGRPHPLVVRAMKLASNRRAATIAIADATLSEVAKLADHKLYYSSNSPAYVRSHTALLGLVQALAYGVYALDESAYADASRRSGLSRSRLLACRVREADSSRGGCWVFGDARRCSAPAATAPRRRHRSTPRGRSAATRSPGPLPLSVAQRPLHRPRPQHGHGQAPQPRRALHAGQRIRHADRAGRLQPRRRLQPGPADHHQGAGPRHPRGLHPHRCGADHGPGLAHYDRRQPVVLINARTGARQLIWSELDANATTPLSTSLLDPPGKEPGARASATSWRCAACAAPTGGCSSRAGRFASIATG